MRECRAEITLLSMRTPRRPSSPSERAQRLVPTPGGRRLELVEHREVGAPGARAPHVALERQAPGGATDRPTRAGRRRVSGRIASLRTAQLRFRLGTARLRVTSRIDRRRRVRFYRQFVRAGELCFDVGANIGDRTELFLRLGARVVAVEPQEACLYKLRARVGDDRHVTIVMQALGAAPGHAELRQPEPGSALASMSVDWIEQVRSSGRFGQEWALAQPVEVTTLDLLIERFGLPVFCKIDVEGYEHEVLQGLSQPIRALSLEFTPERLSATESCLELLTALGEYRFNFSLGESLVLAERRWLPHREFVDRLRSHAGDSETFGDVYARLTTAGS